MKIYLLPGLGADKRMYQSQLEVLSNATVIEHLPPVKTESLADYARRLLPFIDTSSPFVLIGTSLGGMISLELSRLVSPHKIILIASVKSRNELPLFMSSMKYLNLHRLIPGNTYKSFNNLMVKRLDSRGDSTAAQLIKDMTEDTKPEFITWAINAVINWNPEGINTEKVVHIHGTNDQLFPFSKIKNAIAIEGGSHVMNITKSGEVNEVILKVLSE